MWKLNYFFSCAIEECSFKFKSSMPERGQVVLETDFPRMLAAVVGVEGPTENATIARADDICRTHACIRS